MQSPFKTPSHRLDNLLSGLVIAAAFGFVGYTVAVSVLAPLTA